MLRCGSPPWLLGVYGAAAVVAGLRLWHGQGSYFGLGPARGEVSVRSAYLALAALLACIGVGLLVGGDG